MLRVIISYWVLSSHFFPHEAEGGMTDRAAAASALAPTVAHFSLTRRIRRRRRERGEMTAAERRMAAEAEQRGGRIRWEVSTGPF